ncbi:MAG: RNA pseudouridine synthase [Rhodospirillales bacterium CG15_BIG_FIL_POST_REV_8_21_14_020_66_15]|nr:MAG: RNA pseudouridine synthase [Rhodospirillales bacterium CG15_BIG_FIL_POST_REV_8_21_14_020_66_15]
MSEFPGETHDLTIPADLAGSRLDKALASLLPELSRARLQALLAEGRVADGKGQPVTEAKRKVRAGESYAVHVPPPVPAGPDGQEIPLDVVYEDAHLIVIDKPQGLVVHPAAGNRDGTLVNALLAHCRGALSGIGGVERPGIVHRLDKDTSGLMVAAKTDAAHRGLARQFEEHSIDRAYRALVWGVPHPAEGEIAGNIGRDPRNRKKMAVRPAGQGKPAHTFYRVLERFGDRAALVECRLTTGRTHQIRVHMASIGHPVVGDPLYGGRRARTAGLPPALKNPLTECKNQALHAYILGFTHPATGDRLNFLSEKHNYINELCDIFRSV